MATTLPKRSRKPNTDRARSSVSDFEGALGDREEAPDLDNIRSSSGRSKLDDRAIVTISAALTAGMPLQTTAGLVGVSQNTLHRWLRRGQDAIDLRDEGGEPEPSELIYEKLTKEVDLGRSKQHLEGIRMMKLHALKNWQAQIALLKAQDPHTYAERSVSKVEMEVDRPPALDYSALSDEELETLARLQEKAKKALPSGG